MLHHHITAGIWQQPYPLYQTPSISVCDQNVFYRTVCSFVTLMERRCCGKYVAESFVKNPTPTVSYTKARDKVVGKILMTASLLEIKYMKTCFNSSMPTPH